MWTRRQTLRLAAAPVLFDPARLAALLPALAAPGASPADDARNESLWFEVQQAFTTDRTLINLNNGGVHPAPRAVQDAHRRYLDYANQAPVHTMWKVLEPQKEALRERLARDFGCSSEEMAITRNASESLQICQFGFDLEPGDEVLTTTHDYPRMITTFEQRTRREKIVLRQFPLPIPLPSDQEIVGLFERHLSARTRLVLVSHLVNITGQILPVRAVVAMARARGVPVIVDGAHAYAHFPFDTRELDCDYYATSLHKWLAAPFGTGFLHVRRDKIAGLWSLMAARADQQADIRKFEEIGTHPCPNYLAIGEALTFHQAIGGARKAARLVYLRDRWAKRLGAHHRVRLHTSLEEGRACGIATFEVAGIDSERLAEHLWLRHRILTAPIKHAEFQGLRITPSIYTTLEEIDRFADAVEAVARAGSLPA